MNCPFCDKPIRKYIETAYVPIERLHDPELGPASDVIKEIREFIEYDNPQRDLGDFDIKTSLKRIMADIEEKADQLARWQDRVAEARQIVGTNEPPDSILESNRRYQAQQVLNAEHDNRWQHTVHVRYWVPGSYDVKYGYFCTNDCAARFGRYAYATLLAPKIEGQET